MTDFAFIDSGIGGIPYMTTLLQRDGSAKCVYVADSANFPYGTKSHEQVLDCVVPLVKKICRSFEPSVIVLACNTISVNALEELRRLFPDQKFVGTVPAIKLAASVSKKRRLGLLATDATVNNSYNDYLMKSFASDCTLINRGDAALIDFIEKKALTATKEEIARAVQPAVEFFRSNDCDVIILGCTHFLNIKEEIKQACGSELEVVDSVDGVVRHALEVAFGGVAGEAPAQGVVDKTAAERGLGNEGDRAPSLFITGKLTDDGQKQYDALCAKHHLEFGGYLP